MLRSKGLTEKVVLLGIDGMDPELTKYHMEKGLMPNLTKFLERGSAREDLHLLGSHPTITPPIAMRNNFGMYLLKLVGTPWYGTGPVLLGLQPPKVLT